MSAEWKPVDDLLVALEVAAAQIGADELARRLVSVGYLVYDPTTAA